MDYSPLKIDPGLVPHIALFEDYWANALCAWVTGSGRKMTVYAQGDEPWWKTAADTYDGIEWEPFENAPQNEILIASGQSPNGPWSHVVLWRDGAVLWDPHPSDNGLAEPPYQFWKLSS